MHDLIGCATPPGCPADAAVDTAEYILLACLVAAAQADLAQPGTILQGMLCGNAAEQPTAAQLLVLRPAMQCFRGSSNSASTTAAATASAAL
jgi:hypothetical protein